MSRPITRDEVVQGFVNGYLQGRGLTAEQITHIPMEAWHVLMHFADKCVEAQLNQGATAVEAVNALLTELGVRSAR